MANLWELGVAAIVAREVFEAAVIINSYRSLIRKSDLDDEAKVQKYAVVYKAGVGAVVCALIICSMLGIGLALAGQDMNKAVAEIIEGVSKIVAAIAIGQLSLKIPKWMGLYNGKGPKDPSIITDNNLIFNVAWNLFREFGEIGVFLIPFFLRGNLAAIGVSSLVGIAVAVFLGLVLEFLNKIMDTRPLGIFSTILLAFLAAGLFAGGMHELEEVIYYTPIVYRIEGDFWNHKMFPMVLLKPFGYSDHPSILYIVCFVGFGLFLLVAHYFKLQKHSSATVVATKKARAAVSMQGFGTKENIESYKSEDSNTQINMV